MFSSLDRKIEKVCVKCICQLNCNKLLGAHLLLASKTQDLARCVIGRQMGYDAVYWQVRKAYLTEDKASVHILCLKHKQGCYDFDDGRC